MTILRLRVRDLEAFDRVETTHGIRIVFEQGDRARECRPRDDSVGDLPDAHDRSPSSALRSACFRNGPIWRNF